MMTVVFDDPCLKYLNINQGLLRNFPYDDKGKTAIPLTPKFRLLKRLK